MLSQAEKVSSTIRRRSHRQGEIVVRAWRAAWNGHQPRCEYDWDAETAVSERDSLADWLSGLYSDPEEYWAVDIWIPQDRTWCQVTPGAQAGLAREIARRAFNIARIGMSQRAIARRLGIDETLFRKYITRPENRSYRPCPYLVQFALEAWAADRAAKNNSKLWLK